MKNFKSLISFCAIAIYLISLSSTGTAAAATFVDGVVASVGRDPVLYSDVMQEMFSELGDRSSLEMSEEDMVQHLNPLYKEALEREIELRILFKEATALGVVVPDDKIEDRISDLKKQFPNAEAFRTALNATGLTPSTLRERIRRQMMAYTVRMSKQQQFEKEAIISESDLAQYFQDHKSEFKFETRYLVRRFFLKAPFDAKKRDEVRQRLNDIRIRIKDGADFTALAKEMSDGPEASEGGSLGWVLPGDLVEPLNSALLSLPANELSDILETDFGFHFLRIEEIQTEGTTPYEEARIDIEPLLRRKQAEEQYRRWLNLLRQRSEIRILRDAIQ